jgi:hypothetical protein
VGQYDFPVLLGTSLLIYSLRKESAALTVLGAVLLTFKPHVGALILLAALGWLIVNKSDFARRLIRPLVIAGIILFIISFLADPAWIVSYPKMLLDYQNEGNVSACSECASLPVWLSRGFLDGSLTNAARIAIVLLFVFVIVFSLIRSSLKSHELLLSAALLVTLLVSPYLYNYDFLLLLVPFAVLVSNSNLGQKVLILLCYLGPLLALLLYGREGNISLIIASIVMMIVLYTRAKKPVIDGTTNAA